MNKTRDYYDGQEVEIKNLIVALKGKNPIIREEAVSSLVRMGKTVVNCKTVANYLLSALNDQNLDANIIDLQIPENPFSLALTNDSQIFRYKILDVLAKLGEPAIIPVINFLTNDETLSDNVIKTSLQFLKHQSPVSKETLLPIQPLLTSIVLTEKKSSLIELAKDLLFVLSTD
ncbi:MAG: HEAT repeat domain-containing protein [Candidatus Hodarchaeales archaeon]